MARLPIQDTQTATGSNKDIFAFAQKNLGTVPNLFKVLANSPAALQAYAQFNGALAGGKLAAPIREQIAIAVAEQNSCTYCLSAHTVLGKLAGLKPDQLAAARDGEASDPKARAALQFARAVLASRGGVSERDVQTLLAAGFTSAEAAEIVAHVGLNVFTNYFNRAFDVDVDFPRVEAREPAAV